MSFLFVYRNRDYDYAKQCVHRQARAYLGHDDSNALVESESCLAAVDGVRE
jgi:hypothetical protein